jgi:hypothetical protein
MTGDVGYLSSKSCFHIFFIERKPSAFTNNLFLDIMKFLKNIIPKNQKKHKNVLFFEGKNLKHIIQVIMIKA